MEVSGSRAKTIFIKHFLRITNFYEHGGKIITILYISIVLLDSFHCFQLASFL